MLRKGGNDFRNLDELHSWAGSIFTTGIVSFALDASGLPEMLQTLLVLVVAGYLYSRLRRFRQREGGTNRGEDAQEGSKRPWGRRVFGG